MLSKMDYGQHFCKYSKDKAFYSKCSFIVIELRNKEKQIIWERVCEIPSK